MTLPPSCHARTIDPLGLYDKRTADTTSDFVSTPSLLPSTLPRRAASPSAADHSTNCLFLPHLQGHLQGHWELDGGLFNQAILGAAHFYPIYPIIFTIIQFTISNPRSQEG